MKTANSTHKGLWFAVLIAAFSGIAMCNSCGNEAHSNSFVRDEMKSVRQRTTPSNAVANPGCGPNLTGYSVTANWEFDTTTEKSAYFAWVSEQLQRDFSLETSSESGVLLVKRSGGDVESVRIQATASNGMLHIRVEDAIYPD